MFSNSMSPSISSYEDLLRVYRLLDDRCMVEEKRRVGGDFVC